jgi:hypothetical protein
MSNAYYWTPTPCPTCGRGETLEIGTRGGGVFTLKAYPGLGLISWQEWKVLLRNDGEIFTFTAQNNYPTFAEFVEIVEGLKGEGLETNADRHSANYQRDPEGYTIQRYEFSWLRCPECTSMLDETLSSPEEYYCPRCKANVSGLEAMG